MDVSMGKIHGYSGGYLVGNYRSDRLYGYSMANFLMDHRRVRWIFMEYLRILRDIQWILAILWIANV